MDLKDRTKITFHNGLRTIGGTLIEISYKNSRIFFDFGSVYNPSLEIQPNSFSELIETNTINFIDGLYDPKLLFSKSTFVNEGVFVSHVHLDHTKLINFLNPRINLYMSEKTKALLEVLNIKNDFIFPFEEIQEDSRTTRNIIGLKDRESVNIGEINIQILSVDHDAYDSNGYIINTPDLKISYTGDIRLHGYRQKDTLNFCKEAFNSDVLIIEGVSVSSNEVGSVFEEENKTSESILLNNIVDLAKDNPNRQLTFNYYEANIERITNIIKKVSKYREVVLTAYNAKILKDIVGVEVRYYTLDSFVYDLDRSKELSLDTLLNDNNKFFWQIDGRNSNLINRLLPGGLYIHSNAPPFGDYDPNYIQFLEDFENSQVEIKLMYCSGHAYSLDLIRIINMIKPKLLCPIHSFHPERLFNLYGKRFLPEKGDVLELINKEEKSKNEF